MGKRKETSRTEAASKARRKATNQRLGPPSTLITAFVPTVGARIRVHWPAERKWYKGNIDRILTQDGGRIFHVAYDDGDDEWHGDDCVWEPLTTSTARPTEPARAPGVCAHRARPPGAV